MTTTVLNYRRGLPDSTCSPSRGTLLLLNQGQQRGSHQNNYQKPIFSVTLPFLASVFHWPNSAIKHKPGITWSLPSRDKRGGESEGAKREYLAQMCHYIPQQNSHTGSLCRSNFIGGMGTEKRLQ